MNSKWIATVCFILFSYACYDFSIKPTDSGSGDGSTFVSEASSAIVGSPDYEARSGNSAGNGISGSQEGTGRNSAGMPGNAGSGGVNGVTSFDGGASKTSECNMDTCSDGCCEGMTCIDFRMQSNSQCGASGNACKPCPNEQACGSTGACGCDPSSCSKGCCDGNACVPIDSQSNAKCGAAGASCGICGNGQACVSGKCVCNATTCPNGCCSGNKCILSAEQSNQSCGVKGNACGVCGEGEGCVSGVCSCGGASCDGCCSKGKCIASSNSTCGVSGGECVACEAKQRCNAQGECVCDSVSCPNGCCDDQKKCQTPSATACEAGGAACRACSLKNATASCINGSCSVASCATNWGDCNNTASDGCETNLKTSTAHCGACDDPCTKPQNASSVSCSNGSCVPTCSNGYKGSNCDPIDCGPPPDLKNGGYTVNGTTYNNTAKAYCENGYTLSGTTTLTCQASGSWSAPSTSPSCKVNAKCGDGTKNGTEECDYKDPTVGTWGCSDQCKTRTVYTLCGDSGGGPCDSNSDCTKGISGGQMCAPKSGVKFDGSNLGLPTQRCPSIEGVYTQKFYYNMSCVIECTQNSDCPDHIRYCIENPFTGATAYEAKKYCVPPS